jgi:lysyl-tRNA synthetase class II
LLEDFSVQSNWFTGSAKVNTFQFEELIATKLRALYQRKKGRDLFDLWLAIQQEDFDVRKTVNTFAHYMEKGGHTITRLNFEKNLEEKLHDPDFIADIDSLLSPEMKEKRSIPLGLELGGFILSENGGKLMSEGWDLHEAADELKRKMISLLT